MADGAQGKSEILKAESRNCGSDPTSPRLPPRQGVESRKARKKKQKSESVNSCPSFLGCSKPAPIPKHMQVLRAAGAVVMVAGTDGDRRKLFHALPPGCLRDGANSKEIDYGVCVLRLG